MTYDVYDEFTTDTQTKLEELQGKIQEGVDNIWDKWNDSIGSKGYMWFISPAAKIAFHFAEKHLKENIEKLWDEFESFVDTVWEKVEEMAGSPFELMRMNKDYIDAAGLLRDEKTVIENLTFSVGKSWSGDAYDSYKHAAERQTLAIAAVDAGLTSAATACAQGAQQLRNIWRDVIDALLDGVRYILDAIKNATDAGQWVTFDFGPAVKVIGDCLVRVIQLWSDLDKYFDENATVNTDLWRQLNSGLDGLNANNEWPAIAGVDAGSMGRPGDWKH